jgi:hypothetical protein
MHVSYRFEFECVVFGSVRIQLSVHSGVHPGKRRSLIGHSWISITSTPDYSVFTTQPIVDPSPLEPFGCMIEGNRGMQAGCMVGLTSVWRSYGFHILKLVAHLPRHFYEHCFPEKFVVARSSYDSGHVAGRHKYVSYVPKAQKGLIVMQFTCRRVT